jgi:citrate synthase
MFMLTSQQAAHRLGVKIETVYAYVSRGVLARHPGPDGRSSLFTEEEVDTLARRGRPRRTTRPAAIDFPIHTRISNLEGDRLLYRGQDARRLARTATFEQVAELLWTGTLPTRPPTWPRASTDTPAATAPVHAIRLAVVNAAAHDPLRNDLSRTAATARHLVAAAAAALPPAADGRVPRLTLPAGGPPVRTTIAGRLWAALAPGRPRSGLLAAVNAALVLIADHELATSTLAVRVAASTRADPYAVTLAGLGALAGPLHGSASARVWAMFHDAAQPTGPSEAVAHALDTHGVHPGFGHPVYVDFDPRAVEILDLLHAAAGGSRQMTVVDTVLSTVQQRSGTYPNVDFALAALTFVAGMGPEAGEVVFTVGRLAGWIAHAIEEYDEQPLRYRARAVTDHP